MKKILLLTLALLCGLTSLLAQTPRTVQFAERDTCNLYMDIYEPAAPSVKPTVVFVFGGGFISGRRDDPFTVPWFEQLTADGYRVVSIDYRLALKGLKLKPIRDREYFYNAVQVAAEDLFSAIEYMIAHEETLGIDTDNLVLLGSSAGALTILTADWALSNRAPLAAAMPEDFRFKGVIPLSGEIVSKSGKPTYARTPAPTLFVHGTADHIVEYRGFNFFNWGVYGSDRLAKIFRKNGYPYSILRYDGAMHEIAASFLSAWPYIKEFLDSVVIAGKGISFDITVVDPTIKPFGLGTTKDLYK